MDSKMIRYREMSLYQTGESREERRILDDSVPWDGRDENHESREDRRILDDSYALGWPWRASRK